MKKSCGIDGCKAGWFFFELSTEAYKCGVFTSFKELLFQLSQSENIFVDIPIGLPDAELNYRKCDIEARRILARRGASVFHAPIREILNINTYEQANLKRKQLTGKGLSRQTFGIIPKIIEVDGLIRSILSADCIIRESHPEVCFWSLAGGRPMKHNKKTLQGFRERLKVLTKIWDKAEQAINEAILSHRASGVARDDIFDALVLALLAKLPDSQLSSFPQTPQFDRYGLPMEIVYRSF